MTFLAPAAGIIAAAIGVPLLISLYLLKLRRKPLKVSSTLLWEQAVQDMQANVPLRWLRASWLLVLQLMALGCLLVAVARPAVPGTAGIAARTIIVVDCSASMSARDGQADSAVEGSAGARTRLDQAKAAALDLLEQIRRASGQRSEGMVISMGATARVLHGFTTDTRDLRDAVQSIVPTDQPANLDEVLRLVSAAALAGSDGNSLAVRTALVLFSDGSIEPGRERLPASVDVRLVRAGPAPVAGSATPAMPDNLGIIAIGARRDADNPALARVFVRVLNAGAAPVQTTLTCSVDGTSTSLLPLSVPAAVVGDAGEVVPGEAAGTFELDRPAGGLVVVTIPRQDLLAADNTAGVVLAPISKPRILVVGPNDSGSNPLGSRGIYGIDRLLLGALEDAEPGEVKTIDAASYRDAASGIGRVYDLIVFDRVAPASSPAIPTLSIGASLPDIGITLAPLDPARAAATSTRFISWKRSHPLLKNAPLDAVLIAPPMQMTLDEAPKDGGPIVTPLAFGASGPLIALSQAQTPGAAKRLVLAFDLARSNWGRDVSFPVFFAAAVDFLTGRGESAAGRAITTAEPLTVPAAPGATRIQVSGADTFDVDVPPASADEPSPRVSLGVPRLAGVYTCTGVAPGHESTVANLVNARESSLGTHSSIIIGGRESRTEAQLSQDAPKREIWHWFVLAALALLTIEWFIYAYRSRPV